MRQHYASVIPSQQVQYSPASLERSVVPQAYQQNMGEHLGLDTDKKEEYGDMNEERLKLWTEFNLLWECLLQRQLKDTIRLRRSPSTSQTLLDKEMFTKMGDELVRLCDGVEQYGLVDYEMGVAEEQIISGRSRPYFLHQDDVTFLSIGVNGSTEVS